VIERTGRGNATRASLRRFIDDLGLSDRAVLRSSGHLTQWRRPGSPVVRGRVLVAGDAAGLLEPCTREGISFALRSGALAGRAAAAAARADAGAVPSVLAVYPAAVAAELEPEQRAGALLLALFERFPWLVHAVIAGTAPGARSFVRFCRGDLSVAGALSSPLLAVGVRLLTLGAVRPRPSRTRSAGAAAGRAATPR
jgi:flavin-dependent dehydrogenase